MATSPNFSWPEPDNTDLVKNGALAIRTAVDAIDSSMADLKGGTTGQVLSKASGTDMDFTWVAQDDSNAIQNAIVDAKGDLIAATANDTPARLAVGTNGQTLVADSTAATGLKWAASPNFVGCALYKLTDQTLSNGTLTTITLDSEFYDTDGFHSTSTNTSRITIPTGLAGVYLLTGHITYAVNSTGIRSLYFYKNGSIYDATAEVNAIPSFSHNITGSVIVSLGVGDYVEMAGYQNTGGTLAVQGNSTSVNSKFTATFLGA